MDKLDYIQGDLVMVKKEYRVFNFAPENIVCEFIRHSKRDTVIVKAIDCPYSYCVEGDCVTPIHLTPAIVEKNGWELIYSKTDNYFNESNNILLVLVTKNFNKWSAYKVVDNTRIWLRNVYNVSDLQHLLFGLGLNHEMKV